MFNTTRFILLASTAALSVYGTELKFDPSDPKVGPFPNDSLTVKDNQQKTGVRVNLPSADPDAALLNQLDGFSMNPRLRACFTGDVSTSTLRNGMFIVGISRPVVIKVNQTAYDPTSRCAFVKPDQVLEPGSRYALAVTDSIRDATGRKMEESKAFSDCRQRKTNTAYCSEISGLLKLAHDHNGWPAGKIIGGSLFTTLSARDWVEKARAYVYAAPVSTIQMLPPFALATMTSLTWVPNIPGATSQPDPLDVPLARLLPAVDRIVYGAYTSPDFISKAPATFNTIPMQKTGSNVSIDPPASTPQLVPFHIFYPATAKPVAGYPVAIYVHGLTDSQWGAASTIAATLAQQGIATLAIEILGHGDGPASVVQMVIQNQTVTIPSPGRGAPAVPVGAPIPACVLLASPIGSRDCQRQTAVDVFALVRALSQPGTSRPFPDLDPARIHYIGQSFGAIVGTLVNALEPNIRSTVLNVPGGSSVDVARLAEDRTPAAVFLQSRGLMDSNGYYVFRDSATVINSTMATQAQDAFEVADWVNMPGDALAFASKVNKSRLLIQFAKGDREVTNPTNSALIRTVGARRESQYFLFDKALTLVAANQLPSQPHRFLANPFIYATPAQLSIATAAQKQVAGFMDSDGLYIPDANPFLTAPFAGSLLFETPLTLPETLN